MCDLINQFIKAGIVLRIKAIEQPELSLDLQKKSFCPVDHQIQKINVATNPLGEPPRISKDLHREWNLPFPNEFDENEI